MDFSSRPSSRISWVVTIPPPSDTACLTRTSIPRDWPDLSWLRGVVRGPRGDPSSLWTRRGPRLQVTSPNCRFGPRIRALKRQSDDVTRSALPEQGVVRLRRGVAEEGRAAVPLVGLADGTGGKGEEGEAAQEAAVGFVRPRHGTVPLPAGSAQHVERAVVADAGVRIDGDVVGAAVAGGGGQLGPGQRGGGEAAYDGGRSVAGGQRRRGWVDRQLGGGRAGEEVAMFHGASLPRPGGSNVAGRVLTGAVTQISAHQDQVLPERDAWRALLALCIGFFMILVDTTIVSVATPAIIEDLHAEVNSVVWVTSAYLLAYAVPVLITGRLGDRFGQKRLYLTGLTVFTLASLWCGLTNSVEWLIIARVVQGLGASMMTPQTMATITRIFPAAKRGTAMSLWGATAGVATLVGPLLGGVLVDQLGWEWIFFINVPVGLLGFVLAVRLVPTLSTNDHRFDWLGVALSGLGMFLLVFGIQEGHQYDWGTIHGIISVPLLIVLGVVVLGLFLLWQRLNTREPLVPLGLFSDRNFSLANVAIAAMGFSVTAMAFPLMLWAQLVKGWSPTQSALLMLPMAVMS